ncbi:MAG TPA: hypothetical protein VGS02_11420 [Acidobacteriaceae bacterium]|nr:hypothetical protein [Acidobacteriaceae bacterium]
MRSEVYSWRLPRELKTSLEQAARSRKKPVSSILDEAAREWLEKNAPSQNDEAEQRRRREALMKCAGIISGGDPRRSEKVREIVRARLRERHGRRSR